MLQRVARLLTLALFVAATSTVAAGPAHAIGDCKEAPAPEAPGRGISGVFTSPPDELPSGSSWVNGAPSWAHYGDAGLRWNTFDLGCGPDAVRNPAASIATPVANWLLLGPKAMVSGAASLMDAALNPTYLQVFDPVVTAVTGALRRAVYEPWVLLVIVVLGVTLAVRARAGQLQRVAYPVGWAMAVLVVATAVFNAPLKFAGFADTTVPEVVGSIHSEITGQRASASAAAAQGLSNAVLWEQWKVGEFGAANSSTAQRWARDIYEGQALTWKEMEILERDPEGAGQDILDRKQEQWENAADHIERDDPDAYAYLTGERDEARIGAALTAGGAALILVPFLAVACFIMLGCFILLRFAVMLSPVLLTIGILDRFDGLVKGAVKTCMAAIINTVVFGAGFAVLLRVQSILLSPSSGLPQWLGLLLSLVCMVILWIILKPFTRLTKMVGAGDMNPLGMLGEKWRAAKSQAVDAAGSAGKAAATGGASFVADVAAGAVAVRQEGKRWRETHPKEEAKQKPPPAEPPVATETRGPVALPAGTAPTPISPAPAERPALPKAPAATGPHPMTPTGAPPADPVQTNPAATRTRIEWEPASVDPSLRPGNAEVYRGDLEAPRRKPAPAARYVDEHGEIRHNVVFTGRTDPTWETDDDDAPVDRIETKGDR